MSFSSNTHLVAVANHIALFYKNWTGTGSAYTAKILEGWIRYTRHLKFSALWIQ